MERLSCSNSSRRAARNNVESAVVTGVSGQDRAYLSKNLPFGYASKAEELLGWSSEISVEQLCEEMVEADFKRELRDQRA